MVVTQVTCPAAHLNAVVQPQLLEPLFVIWAICWLIFTSCIAPLAVVQNQEVIFLKMIIVECSIQVRFLERNDGTVRTLERHVCAQALDIGVARPWVRYLD